MVSLVTAVSNLPDFPTLHFSSSVRRTKATRIPGWIHKLTALRAIQKHSWSVAFEDVICACRRCSMLRCQSLVFKERMVPRVRSSRIDLGCFNIYLLAHSSTKSTLISQPASLKNISVAVNTPAERIKSSAVNQLLTFCHQCQHQLLWLVSCPHRQLLMENSHTNLQSQT